MKNLIFTFLALLAMGGISFAEVKGIGRGSDKLVEKLSLSSNAIDVSLSNQFVGAFLYSVQIKTSDDDIITFTVKSSLGTPLYTITTSTATVGVDNGVGFYHVFTGAPTYTLSGLGSGTATIEVVGIK